MTQKQTIVFGKQCWPVSPGLKPHNPASPREFFLKGRIPHPQALRKCQTPTPGQKNRAKTTPGAILFKNPAKMHKTGDRDCRNGTEMLICLEI